MFVVVGEAPVMQAMLITRVDEHDLRRETLFETEIPPLRDAKTETAFVF